MVHVPNTMKTSTEGDQQLFEKARECFRIIREEGSYLPGVSDSINPDVPPIWYDAEKFKKAQTLANKYFLSINMASSVGLLLGIQIPIFLEPLLTTGNHKNISKLYRRYLSTALHVQNWYKADPFEEKSCSYKSIRQVRRMHKKICETMNAKTGKKLGVDPIWVSQCEMAMTQWAFVALLILYPKECGFHGATQCDLEHFIYLWRVIGYLMGIEDKYNIGEGSYQECRALYQVILDDFMRPKLTGSPNTYPIGFDVSHGIAKALRPVNPAVRFNVILRYWYKILDIPVDNIPLKSVHRMRLTSTKFFLGTWFKSRSVYYVFNRIQQKRLDAQAKMRDKTEEKLKKKYPDMEFQSSQCPFAVDLGYADIFDCEDENAKDDRNTVPIKQTGQDDMTIREDENANKVSS